MSQVPQSAGVVPGLEEIAGQVFRVPLPLPLPDLKVVTPISSSVRTG
jgi:hypothetical protein